MTKGYLKVDQAIWKQTFDKYLDIRQELEETERDVLAPRADLEILRDSM